MKIFLFANALFITAFIALAIMKISLWSWVAFAVLWTVVDVVVVRLTDIHLTGLQWTLLLAGLTIIDGIVIFFT